MGAAVRRVSLLVGVISLCAQIAWGAVARDAVASSGGLTNSTATISVAVGSISNPAMLAAVYWEDSSKTVSSAQWNSTDNLSAQGSAQCEPNGIACVQFWGGVITSTGTHNLVVTLSGSTQMLVKVVSLSGAHQTTPFSGCTGDVYSASGTSHSHSTTSATGSLVLDAFTLWTGGGTITVNGGQTTESASETNTQDNDILTSKTGAASVSTGYSWVSDFNRWAHTTCSADAAAAGGGSPKLLLTLGAGE